MKYLLIALISTAAPLHAQVAAPCRVVDCPANFMPVPASPNTTARNLVVNALAAVEAAEIMEYDASKALQRQFDKVEAAITPPWYKPWKVISDDDAWAAARSDPEYLRLQENHRTAVVENYKAHNAAILEASKAFQLFPPVTDFTGDPRAAGANMVAKPWLPRYSRHETRDETTGQWRKRNGAELAKEGQSNSIVGGGVATANTRGDGVMEFYGQAFSSPEELAINLYHETSHWVDIAGKSGGFMRSDLPEISFRTEQRAYERAAVFAGQLGVDAQWHQKMAAQFELQADQAQKEKLRWDQVAVRHPDWIGKDRRGSLAMAPAEPELASGDETLLRKKMAEAQKLVKRDRESRERMAEIDRQTAAMPRPHDIRAIIPGAAPSGYSPAVAIQPSPFAQTFPNLAKYAVDTCRQPGSGHSPHMNYYQRPYLEFYGERVQWESWYTVQVGQLQGCAQALFADFVNLALEQTYWKAVDRGWLESQVARYSPSQVGSGGVRNRRGDDDGGSVPPGQSHDPVWGRVGPIIGR